MSKKLPIDCGPEQEWRMAHVSTRLTPCELLRQIYNETGSDSIREKCRVATSMAKSMAKIITGYVGDKWGMKSFPMNPMWKEKDESINRDSGVEQSQDCD